MGPRKTNIKSGASFTWVYDRFVLNVPLYNPNNSVPLLHFSLFAMSSSTSVGGSSTTWMPGKSGRSLIFRGRVPYAHSTISSKLSGFVMPAMRPTLPPGQAARRRNVSPCGQNRWSGLDTCQDYFFSVSQQDIDGLKASIREKVNPPHHRQIV